MKELERWVDKHIVELFPGLALVTAIIEYFVRELKTTSLNGTAPSQELPPETWVYVLVCGVAIYLLGNFWDAVLFDPLFSAPDRDAGPLKRIWWRVLAPIRAGASVLPPAKRLGDVRLSAAQELDKVRADIGDFAGLYRTVARLGSFTKQWKEEIEKWVDRSKVARSFLFPLLLLGLFRYRFSGYQWPFEKSFLKALWLWQWDLALFVVALLAYVWLRLIHMKRLYALMTPDAAPAATESVRAAYLIPKAELPYLSTALSNARAGAIDLKLIAAGESA